MAKDNRPSASSVLVNRDLLPWRSFKDRPTPYFVEEVLASLKATAEPETIEALYRNKIPKDADFYIIRKITLDGRKRPNGDNAPCPMCTPNKFLEGALIWLPNLQACAIIGHCCADRDKQAAADREYKARTKRDGEEDYLLDNLLHVPARLEASRSWVPAATEARTLFRKFRGKMSSLHQQLRYNMNSNKGRLVLSEVVNRGRGDYVGPAGLSGQFRDIDFGLLAGASALSANYDPVVDLAFFTRQLESIEVPTPEEQINFIAGMTENQRVASVATLKDADIRAAKFGARLQDFISFFSPENASLLDRFGNSPHNSVGFAVRHEYVQGKPRLNIRHDGKLCILQLEKACLNFRFKWPGKV